MKNILSELNALLKEFAPVETGVFSGEAPDEYFVVTPLSDTFELHADNQPEYETQEARISIFSKSNYIVLKNNVVMALLAADFTITARRYIGRGDDSGYFHYIIDASGIYPLEV